MSFLRVPGRKVNAPVLRTPSEPKARLERLPRPPGLLAKCGRQGEGGPGAESGDRLGEGAMGDTETVLMGCKSPFPQRSPCLTLLPHEFLNAYFCKIIFTPSPMPLLPFLD